MLESRKMMENNVKISKYYSCFVVRKLNERETFWEKSIAYIGFCVLKYIHGK